MKETFDRIQHTAFQLSITDSLLDSSDNEYHLMRNKLLSIRSYSDFLNVLYQGQERRQMVLGDLLEYIITGRGYWLAEQGRKQYRDFLRIILYIVNLILIQESVFSYRTPERQKVLKKLRKQDIAGFFNSEEELKRYREFEAFEGMVSVTGPTRPLYKVMDSITPKPVGTAIELIVYLYLLNRRIGYVVPLLLNQRLFKGLKSIAPPDYLVLLRGGNSVGIEVGGGMGQFSLQQGKIEQANRFIGETGIPVVTAGVPHIYRCETCQSWITFCDEVIERTAKGECNEEVLSCKDCSKYYEGRCLSIIYYGQIKKRGERRRHHYYHYIKNKYVQNTSLATDEAKGNKLIQYFPAVKGLEYL